jgi:phosphoesterase RecJ-like protein
MIDLIKECEGARTIGISGHVRPDGDCVGSCLALRKYLLNAFPDVQVTVNLQTPPRIFHNLAGYEGVQTEFPEQPH